MGALRKVSNVTRINDAIELKRETEKAITQLINDFVDKTDLIVEEVSLYKQLAWRNNTRLHLIEASIVVRFPE